MKKYTIDLVLDLREKYDNETLQQMFINRTDDYLFEEIGRSIFNRAVGHKLVWLGYEVAIKSQHCDSAYIV